MELDLTDGRRARRDALRAVLVERFAPERVRAGFERPMWDELWSTGVLRLRPDGFGWADSAVAFEELGAWCVPGPLVPSVVVQGRVDGIVGAVERPDDGAAVLVENLDLLDALVVFDREGAWVVDAEVLDGEPEPGPLDPSTPVWRTDLPRGGRLVGPAAAAAWWAEGATLTAAFLVGIADRLTTMAVEWVRRDRSASGGLRAYGPLLKAMAARTEAARAAVGAAAAHLDDPELPGAPRAVADAKVLAGEAARENGRRAVWLAGRFGRARDPDLYRFVARSWVLDGQFGVTDRPADAITRLAGST